MPYIGKEPVAGNFVLLDSITTSATATYALTKDSVAYSPESARNMIVSLNGVTQAPEAAFTVSGSNITFSSALTASDVIDYILVLGDVLSVGTPSDGTVGTSQMSYPLGNFSSTGIDDNATSTAITIDSSQRVGIGTASPSRLLTLSGSGATLLSLVSTDDDNCQVLFGDSASDTVGKVVYAHSDNHMRFETNSAERMRIDAGGSVLIGKTTPTDLHNTWNHLIIGEKGAIISENGAGGIDGITISDNAYIDADTGSYAYQTTAAASKITQSGGVTTFSNAASGTAGTGLSFTESMRIDSSGNLLMNTTGEIQFFTSGYGIRASTGLEIKANDFTRFLKGSTEYMRIDTAGKVGVGINNPSGSFHVTTKDASGSDVFVVAQNTTSNRVAGYRVLDESGAASLQMQYDNGGNAASIINPNNGALSIYLGGTGAANALDDYEEGTWEPALIGTSSNPSVTYHSDTGGFYIKVGRLVYVTGTIRTTAYSGGSGNLLIASIPFGNSARTNGDNADGVGTAYTNIWNGTSGEHPTFVRSKQNDSAFFIGQNSHDAVATLLDVGDWGSTCMMSFTLVYHTN